LRLTADRQTNQQEQKDRLLRSVGGNYVMYRHDTFHDNITKQHIKNTNSHI